jgi:hypothetical protein
MSFREGFETGLAGFRYMDEMAQAGLQRRQQKNRQNIAGDYYAGNVAPGGLAALMGDYARNGGDPRPFQQDQEAQHKRMLEQVGQISALIAAAPPEARPNIYANARPKLEPVSRELGVPLPDVWSDDHLDEVRELARAYGPGNGSMPAEVTAFRELTKGFSAEDELQARRVRAGLEARPPSGLPYAPGTVTGSDGRERLYRFDKRTGQLQLVERDSGPPDQTPPPSNVQFDFAPGTPQAVIDATRAYASADQGMQGGSPYVGPDPIQQARDKAYAGEVGRVEGERAATIPQRQGGLETTIRGIDETMASVDRAMSQVPGFGTTGFAGAAGAKIPGTPAYNLRKTIESVKANLGFDRLQTMRDNSPTGGALGQVAVQELEFLQSAVASLDQGQDDAQLLDNLKRVRTHYEKWKEAVQQAGQRTGLQPPAPTPAPSARVEWVRGPNGKLQRKK